MYACVDQTDRGNTDCFPEPASLQLLAAYLPNPSSVAKDPLPRVTPSHRHLGNRCRGELPAGIADLRLAAFHGAAVGITATGCTVCGWTDMRVHNTQKCGGKLQQQTYVMRSISFSWGNTTRWKTWMWFWLETDYFDLWYSTNGNNLTKLLGLQLMNILMSLPNYFWLKTVKI